MANPQLTTYIRENLTKFSKEAVIQSLSSAGWSAIDISAAFMELEHPAPVAPVPPVVPPAPAPAPAQTPVQIVIEPAQPSIVIPPQKPDLPQRGEFSAVNSPTSGAVAPAYVSDKPVSVPVTAVQTKPQVEDPNDAFLAEMTKRRKEAEALNPQTSSQGGVTISVGGYSNPQTTATQTGLVGMVMKTGLVKTEQQANMVLIGVVVVCLGLSLWFIL